MGRRSHQSVRVSAGLRSGTLPAATFDVAVVGAGVVGCAIARLLARRGCSVMLLDAADDVGDVTSKASTAIHHTGFDAKPGTLESGLVRRGHALLREYAEAVGIPLATPGALLVAWTAAEEAALPGIAANAEANGYARARPVALDELRAREPELGGGARAALEIPDEGIVCPWTTTLALATEALQAGASLALCARVLAVRAGPPGDAHALATTRGDVFARRVVNAAGLGSDEVDRMFGHDAFTITPRRGELVVFDKLARPLIDHILLPVPTGRTKGVLVAPTVYGNVLLGPTAEDVDRKDERRTTEAGLAGLFAAGERILPALGEHEVTATYVGLRAATEHVDYQFRAHDEQGYVCVGGVRSTGLSAALALAEHTAEALGDAGLGLAPEHDTPPITMANIGELAPRPYAQPERIAADPEYGRVVCFCERVTAGELRDALASRIPPVSPEGLRRRTRALMGRCQGFYCGAAVTAALADAAQEHEHDR